MEKKINPMAIAGLSLSASAAPLLAAAWLCLIGVMLSPLLALVFGSMAGMTAAAGIAHSGIGLRLSFRPEYRGAGFACAGLVTGTALLAVVLTFTALLILDGGQIFAGATGESVASQLIQYLE